MFSPKSVTRTARSAVVLVALAFAACSGPDATAPSGDGVRFDHIPGEPAQLHTYTICKFGTAASFRVDTTRVNTSNVPIGPTGTHTYNLNAGECLLVARAPTFRQNVVVTELAAVNVQLDSITTQAVLLNGGVQPPVKVTGTSTVSGIIHGDLGQIANFYNTPLRPDLRITKTADQATVPAGSPIGFTVTVSNVGAGTALGVTLSDTLPSGAGINWSESPDVAACAIVANVLSCNFGNLATGASVSVHVTSPTTEASCGTYNNRATAVTTTSAATATASTTVECPPPPGFEGCTPGFWKQDQHFAFWTAPFTPGTLIKDVFSGAVGYTTPKTNLPLGDQTLLAGLGLPGGNELSGAAGTLMRAAIAAVLNAASPNVNYPLSVNNIVTAVNNALASQDRDTILGLAGDLDENNNLGCTAKD